MRLSIFTTVFIVFLIVVSPLYAISILINVDGQSRTRREIYEYTLSNMDFYVSGIENTLKNIVTAEVALINNADINDISRLQEIPYDFDTYRKIETILYKLQDIKESSAYIQQAYILFPASGLKVTERSRRLMTTFDYSCVTDGDFINGFPFNNHASGTYINITSEYHRDFPDYKKISYVIVVKIDTDKIAREMNDYFVGSEDQMCFLGETNGMTIYNNIDGALLPEITAFASPGETRKGIESLRMQSSGKQMLVAYRGSPYLKTTFILLNEEHKFLSGLRVYHYWIWILSGVMLVLLVIFTIWMRKIIAIPMNRLIEAIKRGIAGDQNNMIEYRSNEEFMYIYQQFNEMLEIQRTAINQIYERDLLIKDTELKMLQYQINPHFLYNCFFLMYQMMEAEEYNTARRMMALIGNYFSFVTKSENYIPLANELRFCADYIGIQMMRFSSRITARIADMPETFAELTVPRIIILPILENCYKHGLVNKEDDGLIVLSFDSERGMISIEDNGDDLTDERLAGIRSVLLQEKSPTMSGLWNVHHRLRQYLGAPYGLDVARSELGGLRVEMLLPVEAK